MERDKMIKINLGSGPDGISGWFNYDWGWLAFFGKRPGLLNILVNFGVLDKSYIRRWPEIYLRDLRKGIPMSEESVDWIYCSNFFEHLEKYQTERLLSESYRVLKIGGRMRMVIPDLNKIINEYKKTNDADKFCREFYGYDKFQKILGVKKYFYNLAIRGHQWMYDEKSIILIIRKAGFKKVEISGFRKSKMPDVDKLDLEIHRDLGMYIEAQKI